MRTTETATFGGGCFWCIEAVFGEIRGVTKVTSGYAGGATPDPTYETVCDGDTGHAEVVQVEFDPSFVSYRDLLEVFFHVHDPTTPDRQGHDEGPQYRSIVLAHTPQQQAEAERMVAELTEAKIFDDPIVTEIAPLARFHPAEAYHQGYFRANPRQPYCRAVIAPKVDRFRATWKRLLKG